MKSKIFLNCLLVVLLLLGTHILSAQPEVRLRNIEKAAGANYTITTDATGAQYYVPSVSGAIDVNLTPIAYVPSVSGNASNLNEVVTDPNQDIWIIDQNGNAKKMDSGASGGGGTSSALTTISASGETSMRVRYYGNPPTLTKTSDGNYLLTIPTDSRVDGLVWTGSSATYSGGSVTLTLRDTDLESLYANYTVLGSTTGDEVGQLQGITIRQTVPQSGDIQATFPNVSSVAGDFIIIAKIF